MARARQQIFGGPAIFLVVFVEHKFPPCLTAKISLEQTQHQLYNEEVAEVQEIRIRIPDEVSSPTFLEGLNSHASEGNIL